VTFLSTAEDAYGSSGRGCVIVPALPRSSVDFRLQMRDSIQLRNPDGQIVDTYIAGIELLCGPEVKDRMVSLLPQNVTKRDAPNGTEIWLIRER
jgi:hypothetical protein